MALTGVIIAYFVFTIAGIWKTFEKAGEPGWASIVPFMNLYKLCKIGFGVGWLFLVSFVPVVNFILNIILGIKMAQAFGRGVLFGLGIAFLPGIFYMILGFGSATYQGQTNVINKI
ncbi:hypothetical protein FMM67_07660 [Clostridium sp. ASF356]|nr:hypothetical protein [Clostridium sp. MD294]